MEIIEKRENLTAIFQLNGRLDLNTSPEFDEKITSAIENGTNFIVVDCKTLDYITSAGLRILNKTAKKLKKVDGKIVLCSMEDYVKEVFEISGFDTFLPIVTDLEKALEKLKT